MGKETSKLSNSQILKIQRLAPFSAEEIAEWYMHFMHDHPTGHISSEEFLAIYKKMFPKGDPRAFAKQCFKSFDENNDGTIDFQEFIVALGIIARGTTETKLQWMFKLYDLNGDGTITLPELQHMFKSISLMSCSTNEFDHKQKAVQMFAQLDKDGEGHLTETAFVNGARHDTAVKELIQFVSPPKFRRV